MPSRRLRADPSNLIQFALAKGMSGTAAALRTGAALTIGGVILLVVAPGEEPESAGLRFGVSPQGAAVHGRF